MSGTLRDLTAGFTTEGTYTPPNLLAGDAPLLTTSLPLAASTAVSRGQVLAKNTAGNLVPVDPAQTDGREIAICIAVEAAASSGSVRNIPVYTGGTFNHEALVWPGAWNTLALRRAAFDRTPIQIDAIAPVRAP